MSDTRLGSVTLQMENLIREFERASAWRLSLSARIVLQQALIALSTDTVGVIVKEPAERRLAQLNALHSLRPFLDELATEADKFLVETTIEKNDDTEIGAIFVMTHIDIWRKVKECGCVPQ